MSKFGQWLKKRLNEEGEEQPANQLTATGTHGSLSRQSGLGKQQLNRMDQKMDGAQMKSKRDALLHFAVDTLGYASKKELYNDLMWMMRNVHQDPITQKLPDGDDQPTMPEAGVTSGGPPS